MKKALVIAAVLMAAALTGLLLVRTAYADFTCTHAVCAATDSDSKVDDNKKSNTKVEISSKQSIVASGENLYVQNCAENNFESQVTSGDEGVDCHNNQAESEIQNQSATE